jgi:hypothetical protein
MSQRRRRGRNWNKIKANSEHVRFVAGLDKRGLEGSLFSDYTFIDLAQSLKINSSGTGSLLG